jgi:hypothetical protein
LFYADGPGHISDGSGHMSDLGFSDAVVSFAQPLADTVLLVSWSRLDSQVLGSPSPPDTMSLLAPLGSLSFVALSLSLFVLFILALSLSLFILFISVHFVYFGLMVESYGTPAAVSAPS